MLKLSADSWDIQQMVYSYMIMYVYALFLLLQMPVATMKRALEKYTFRK